MKKIVPAVKVYVARSQIAKAGRGVFASKAIRKGELIETCPVIVLKGKDVPLVRETELANYNFIWHARPMKVSTRRAICLGFGSLYNHSYEPNATYQKNLKDCTIDFRALTSIKKGEEITTNYNFGNPKDKSRLWIRSIKPA